MERRRIITIIVFGGIFLALFLIILFAVAFLMFGDPQMLPGDKVALVELSGPIYSSQRVVDQLHRYRDNDSVKAIVLRINSPGGVVAPVQEIHRELTKMKKKVVVSMGSTAASGGYYIACAADWIFANPGTVTGSIGVIMQFAKIGELMEKLGIKREVVKSGDYKDAGSMYRELTPEERELFQDTIDDVYDQFVDAILEGRRHKELTRERIEEIADGRILSGRQALEENLVDELGDLSDAIEYAGKLGGIEGKPRVIKMRTRKSLLDLRFSIQVPPAQIRIYVISHSKWIITDWTGMSSLSRG
jgi:protease-4